MPSQFPKTVEFLETHGIPANLILVDGIYPTEYATFETDDVTGRKIIGTDGLLKTTRKPWPEELGGEKFGKQVLDMILEDIGEKPAPTIRESVSIDQVVLSRRRYDADPSDDALAKEWIDAENLLTPQQYDAYQALYRKVSETLTTKRES